jgi:K+-transporting ATPase ATPase C chain
MKLARPCAVTTALLLVVCCALYPGLVTVVAQAAFPGPANGSLVSRDGKIVGSSLIGQSVGQPALQADYFWGRPSGASVDKDTGLLVSGGSNYGPLNASLADEVDQRVKALRDTGVTGPIPADLVTKSASGVDPHVSPAAAEVQVARVARERRLPEADVREIVRAHTEGSTLGLLGEPRVDVLAVNLALDARVPPRPAPPPTPPASASASSPSNP